MEISLCIDSEEPQEAILLWQNGAIRRHKHVSLDFDATENLGMWRIIWNPSMISWFVNGELLGRVRGRLWLKMPDVPMHIRVSVFPREIDEDHELLHDVKFSMHLFKISFKKMKSEPLPTPKPTLSHDEPFTENVTRKVAFSLILLMVLGSLLIVCLRMSREHNKYGVDKILGDYEVLLNP